MNTIHDPRYIQLIESLKLVRQNRKLSQTALATKLGQPQPYIAKVETFERRLDVIELFDWLVGLDYAPLQFFQDIGWFPGKEGIVPVPIAATVEKHTRGVLQHLLWEGQIRKILLEGITEEQYLDVEADISIIFKALNSEKPELKNRDAIVQALELAFEKMPNLNPSDIYQHLIYRLYVREYNRSKPEQSWVRAGGEALELFIERHYTPILRPHGISIKALISGREKAKALDEMGLAGQVGDSKLDVALYGEHRSISVIFGGVHSKASLAERVSDDVPCSEAMMRTGLASFLWTFDSKSFPPPGGDLVNRGELGSTNNPSDKRRYIEEHGSFDACFSYNLRSQPSLGITPSGKKIYVCSFKAGVDSFPSQVVEAWDKFKKRL